MEAIYEKSFIPMAQKLLLHNLVELLLSLKDQIWDSIIIFKLSSQTHAKSELFMPLKEGDRILWRWYFQRLVKLL